eukprot:CAMPEP_0204637556 /NCGR_PEP_ID=MMETSP0717-20131115/36952_1 /ASSEMBLY_ACC=CAM_ASM_000666 /TAXON_ID=230516 /ORGANISM="Chaetoceros curvisetus" /LENGTH=81 /DNA_ID=CAMNT_0051657011 /DNA_START=83 /DNA_END=328 /DNA_ORIENTATION=+
MVKVFLDPSTKAKVRFISNSKSMKKELEETFHRSSTEKCIFGEDDNGEISLRQFDVNEYYNLPFHVSFDEKLIERDEGIYQ